MDEGMGAEPPMPPMPEAPAAMPPAAPPMPGLFADENVAGGGDETLAALQDALVQVGDPKAIMKLADIIKEYVEENYPVEDAAAPVPDEEIPPEAIVEALAGEGEGDPLADELLATEGDMDAVGEEEVSPEVLLDALTRSEATEIEKCDKGDANENFAEGEGAAAEEPGANDPTVPVSASAEEEMKPDIQINLFLGAKMDDIITDNKEKGLTEDKDIDTESFKVCDNPIKKSIDDLMNERMRTQSGIDGKRYKISKSATEMARDQFQTIQKSIGSFDAVKNMRVGDVLSTMWALQKRGATSIEKSYEPVIDEIVKYCDNNVGAQYTEPLFKSFGIDIGKIYEPIDTEPFERVLSLGDVEKEKIKQRASADKDRMAAKGVADDATQTRVNNLKGIIPHFFAYQNEAAKRGEEMEQWQILARLADLYDMDKGSYASRDDIRNFLKAYGLDDATLDSAGVLGTRANPITDSETILRNVAPLLFARRIGVNPGDAGFDSALDAYDKLIKYEPTARMIDWMPYGDKLDDLFNEIQRDEKLRLIAGALSEKTGINIPSTLQMASTGNMYGDANPYLQHEFARQLVKAKKFLMDPTTQAFKIGRKTYDPQKIMADQYIPEYTEGESLNMPKDIFTGTFSSYYSPAFKLGDDFYAMNKTGLPYLRNHLQGAIPNFAGSKMDTTLAAWEKAASADKLDFDAIDKAKENFMGSFKNNAALSAQMADIFGADGAGYQDVVLATSPIRGLITGGGNKPYGFVPEFSDMLDKWYKANVMKGYDTSQKTVEELLNDAEDITSAASNIMTGASIDPRTRASKAIGGDASMITHNYGNAYKGKKYKLTSALTNADRAAALAGYDTTNLDNATTKEDRSTEYGNMIDAIKAPKKP